MWYPTHEYQHDQPSRKLPPDPAPVETTTATAVLNEKQKNKEIALRGVELSIHIRPRLQPW
ncbi:MAG: hypothetical protein ACP5HG_18540, partial [Anaerolineae bacterium]